MSLAGLRMQQFEAPMVLHYDVGQQIKPHTITSRKRPRLRAADHERGSA
jgi:hypothetical protein